MTYCVGIMLEDGLVFASDTRTNAGVDRISTFPKMTVWERPDRVLVLLATGNLATTQGVTSRLEEAMTAGSEHALDRVPTMFRAAEVVGDALRQSYGRDAQALKDAGIDGGGSFILGGQIKGERQRLFQVYAAGNFIEAVAETPYFQTGEVKYGKPMMDRVVKTRIGLIEAAKCALVSFDATMKSNISVAPPIDLLLYRKDTLRVGLRMRVEDSDPYFLELRRRWNEGLRQVFAQLPDVPWTLA
ncbi:MAG: peptidase [Alphaproteobacteria bacterium]|nr:peptidase [Alphaproteobacteria bacterium]